MSASATSGGQGRGAANVQAGQDLNIAVAQIPCWNTIPHLPSADAIAGIRCDPGARELLRRLADRIKSAISSLPRHIESLGIANLEAILCFCRRRNVDILVMPEDSVPLDWLPRLQRLLETGRSSVPLVVAGSHEFLRDRDSLEVYRRLKIRIPSKWREAHNPWYTAPVFVRGRCFLAPKRTCAGPTPQCVRFPFPLEDWAPRVRFALPPGTKPYGAVLICSDFHDDEHRLAALKARNLCPQFILVPAYNDRQDAFWNDASLLLTGDDIVTAAANRCERLEHKSAGYSFFAAAAPPGQRTWQEVVSGKPISSLMYAMPPESTGVHILQVHIPHDHSKWHTSSGQVTVAPIVHEWHFPECARLQETMRRLGDEEDPFSELNRKLDFIWSKDARRIRQDALRSSRCDGLFKAKLQELEDTIDRGRGKKTFLRDLQKHVLGPQDDYERLVDAVFLPKSVEQSLWEPVDEIRERIGEIERRGGLSMDVLKRIARWWLDFLIAIEEVGYTEKPADTLKTQWALLEITEPRPKPSSREHFIRHRHKSALEESLTGKPKTQPAPLGLRRSEPKSQPLGRERVIAVGRRPDFITQLGALEMGLLRLEGQVRDTVSVLCEMAESSGPPQALLNALLTLLQKSLLTFPASRVDNFYSGLNCLASQTIIAQTNFFERSFKEFRRAARGRRVSPAIPKIIDDALRDLIKESVEAGVGHDLKAKARCRREPGGERTAALSASESLVRSRIAEWATDFIDEESRRTFELHLVSMLRQADELQEIAGLAIRSVAEDLAEDVKRAFVAALGLSVSLVCRGNPHDAFLGLLLVWNSLHALMWTWWGKAQARLSKLKPSDRQQRCVVLKQEIAELWPKLVSACSALLSDPDREWRRFGEIVSLMSRILQAHLELVILSTP